MVIIGGEGNGGVIASCIEDNRKRFGDLEWEVAGFLNDFDQEVDGYPVIGKLDSLPKLIAQTDYFFSWAIHLVGRNYKTSEMFAAAQIPIDRLATIVHKSAFIGKGVSLGPGAFVMANCYIGPYAHIGKCSLIMANCCIGHNIYIDDLCHCSVGAIMTGYSRLEYCSDLAVGSTLIAYKVVGKFSMVAANAVATHDIPEGEIWAGTPAKMLKPMRKD